jgi:hopanoid biosynthesis associated protein HpnK
MAKKIIINADDFGLCEGVNRAVVKAHTEGLLTSATIMTNAAASEQAVQLAKSLPSLGVGLHLNLTEGKPLLKDGPAKCLAGPNGDFAAGPEKLFFLSITSRRIRHAIELEADAQIRWMLDKGLKLTHIDSHKHIHTIPPIFRIVCRLAQKYGIAAIRWPMEARKFTDNHWPPPAPKGLARSRTITALAKINRLQNSAYFKTDAFLGIAHTGRIDLSFLQSACRQNSAQVTEIMTHPAFPEGLDPAKTRLLEQRKVELDALCCQQTKSCFEEAKIELVHYGQL